MSRMRNRSRVAAALGAALGMVLMHGCVPDAPQGELPTGPADRFSVTLAWDAPTTDAAGGSLADLSGYRLYYIDVALPEGADSAVVEVGDVTQATVKGLLAGDYVFSVTALDMDGNESDFSEPLAVKVGS